MALQVWLPLNGTLENKGISDLQFSNTNTSYTTVDSNGKIGSCYNNSSHSSGGLISNKTINLGTNQSMFCWINFTQLLSTDGLGGGLVSQHRYTNNSGMGLTIKYVSSSTGYLSVNTGNGSNRTFNTYYGATLMNANTWYHVGYTYDGANIRLYVNGKCDKTYAFTGMYTPEDSIIVYGWSLKNNTLHTNYKLVGKLNDVRIYDHCLSAAEVKEIAKGLIIHYKLDQNFNILNNIFNYPTFNTSTSNGGWSHWAQSGSSNYTYGQNTDKNYIYNKTNTYSHWVSNKGTPTYSYTSGNYLLYQSPAFDGGYRSMQCIIKEENSLPIDESIVYPVWNADAGGTSIRAWTDISYLGDGFYLCKCEGIKQDGSNDLIGCYTRPGYKVYFSECYCENDTQICSNIFPILKETKIIDSSGYGYNGITSGTLYSIFDSGRNNISIFFDNNTNSYIKEPNFDWTGINLNNFTISCWYKSSDLSKFNNSQLFAIGTSSGWTNIRIGLLVRYNGRIIFNLSNGSSSLQYNCIAPDGTLTTNKWYHIVCTYDNKLLKIYVNGVLKTTYTSSFAPVFNSSARVGIGAASNGAELTYGNLSDVRFYTTTLSADDVLDLYHTGAKMDKFGRVHSYSFNEKQDKLNIGRIGVFTEQQIAAISILKYLKYDPLTYIEPDGSVWVRVYHHNNPANAIFNSTDDFTNGVYKDADRWFNVNVCNYLDKWEFIVKGRHTTSSSLFKIRWRQSYNPMTAKYANVSAANVTKITSNGYDSYSTEWGGLYKNNAKAYLTTNNGIGSNWFGAIGAWTLWNEGIPGWGPEGTSTNVVTTTGFNDLYVRIDNVAFTSPTQTSINKNKILVANDFIEI